MKAKEITAIVRYYDMAMCNLQAELNTAHKRCDEFELAADTAQKDLSYLRAQHAMRPEPFRKFADMSQEELTAWLETTETKAAEFDKLLTKYAGLEQLHEAAVISFQSSAWRMQLELDAAKMEAKEAKQAMMYSGHALDSRDLALSCVTIDALAHCDGQNQDALRALMNWMKEFRPLNIQERADLNAMLANLEHDF